MDIEIITIVVSPFQQNCRLVKDRTTGEAVLIDPGDEAERILEVVERHDARVTQDPQHARPPRPRRRRRAAEAGAGRPLRPARCRLPHPRGAPSESGRMWGMPGVETPDVDEDLEGVDSIPFAGGEIRVLAHARAHARRRHLPVREAGRLRRHALPALGRPHGPGRRRRGLRADARRTSCSRLADDMVVHCGHGPVTTIGRRAAREPLPQRPDRDRRAAATCSPVVTAHGVPAPASGVDGAAASAGRRHEPRARRAGVDSSRIVVLSERRVHERARASSACSAPSGSPVRTRARARSTRTRASRGDSSTAPLQHAARLLPLLLVEEQCALRGVRAGVEVAGQGAVGPARRPGRPLQGIGERAQPLGARRGRPRAARWRPTTGPRAAGPAPAATRVASSSARAAASTGARVARPRRAADPPGAAPRRRTRGRPPRSPAASSVPATACFATAPPARVLRPSRSLGLAPRSRAAKRGLGGDAPDPGSRRRPGRRSSAPPPPAGTTRGASPGALGRIASARAAGRAASVEIAAPASDARTRDGRLEPVGRRAFRLVVVTMRRDRVEVRRPSARRARAPCPSARCPSRMCTSYRVGSRRDGLEQGGPGVVDAVLELVGPRDVEPGLRHAGIGREGRPPRLPRLGVARELRAVDAEPVPGPPAWSARHASAPSRELAPGPPGRGHRIDAVADGVAVGPEVRVGEQVARLHRRPSPGCARPRSSRTSRASRQPGARRSAAGAPRARSRSEGGDGDGTRAGRPRRVEEHVLAQGGDGERRAGRPTAAAARLRRSPGAARRAAREPQCQRRASHDAEDEPARRSRPRRPTWR